ncbi:membrane protein insertion efficiency factor YidD [Hansschlegelia zhihuaiae]|uniref:membrane protein insertion efficiency factor YidD n=1 Tax=Hansschlegelia zhihuaiae TaxID=405005 RepID=UPI00247A4849|nr:membrane protein insertion efficiency factor YidD [Hansschlegelia zhihuaiae]
MSGLPRLALRAPILAYRYSLSMFMGRTCRYLPSCSEYADEAIARHGAWAGGWMAASRVCRCHPCGGDGFDPVPRELPSGATWSRPWRYARQAKSPVCEHVVER